MDGKKDAFGNVIPSTSLKILIAGLLDFIQEETLLQYHGRMLGVLVDRTPKCHPELAGEGVEYDWGYAKNAYRRLPITSKKGKEQFRKSVRECINIQHITKHHRQHFSRRAREYMLAYKIIDDDRQETEGQAQKQNSSHLMIEKILKKYKSHRSAADFDSGYISAIVSKMRGQSESDDG